MKDSKEIKEFITNAASDIMSGRNTAEAMKAIQLVKMGNLIEKHKAAAVDALQFYYSEESWPQGESIQKESVEILIQELSNN